MGAKEYKNLKEIYYFKNATNETIKNDNNNDAENIHEKVSLTFSLENCESIILSVLIFIHSKTIK